MTRDEYIKHWQENARGGNGCGPHNSFANHVATRIDYAPDVYAIDWRNNDGSGSCYVRYMFDGSSLTIRGDLGEFLLDRYGSEPAALWLGNMRDPYYIKSKMRCATDEYDHIDEIFEADLAEWFAGQGCSDEDDEETEATIRELWHDCKEFLEMALCSDKKMVERYDYEELTHVGGFGRVLSARFILVVEGLKMALEQLGEVEKP